MSAAAAVDLEKEVILPLLQPLLFSTSLREDAQKVEDIVKKQVNSFSFDHFHNTDICHRLHTRR